MKHIHLFSCLLLLAWRSFFAIEYASALPISQVGKACWTQLANGNAASVVDIGASGASIPGLAVKGTETFESGMNTWQQDGASYAACVQMMDGATQLGDVALLGTEMGAMAAHLVAQGAGWGSGAAASGGVLSVTGPLAIAFLAGTGLALCLEGAADADTKQSLQCMEEEHARLNDDGLDCSWFDRQISRKKKLLPNLEPGTEARKTVEDQIKDLERRKTECKKNRDAIRDALSVGDCKGSGMHSEFMTMRCESMRALFCSKDPRWERRRSRLKAMFPQWGIEYIHCGTPIVPPTPTTAPTEVPYFM